MNRAVESVTPRERTVSAGIPSLIKRNTFLIAAAQAGVGATAQLVPTLSAIMVVRLLGSAGLSGIGVSIMNGSRLLVAYPIGMITDRYGRKPGLLLGLLLGLVGALLAALSMLISSFALFLAAMLVLGLGGGALQQLRVAAADMYLPARRAEGLGYVLTGSLAGALGGPALVSAAQALSSRFSLDALALSWALVPVILAPMIALVLLIRPDPKAIAAHLELYYPGYEAPVAAPTGEAAKSNFWTFVQHYPNLVAFACSFAVQGNMSMIMAVTALTLDHHGYSLPAISLSIAIHVVGMFGLSLPLGKAADRFGRRPVLLAGVIIAGAGSPLVVATPLYWVITLGTFLVGLGWSCVNVAATALLSDTTTASERGRVIGTSDTFGGAAGVALPFIGGLAIQALGLPSIGVIGIGLMVLPFILLLRLKEVYPGRYG